MKISTKGRYALRLMLDLATYNTGEPVSLKNVASRQEISEKYLEQIIPPLTSNGLIVGIQGKGGGYRLTRDPADYKIGEILRLTEKDLAPVECLKDGAPKCERRTTCKTVGFWEGLKDTVNEYLDSSTLRDLL